MSNPYDVVHDLDAYVTSLEKRIVEKDADIAELEVMSRNQLVWQPIETAPKNNKHPLWIARFNDDGTMQSFDYDASWEREIESWEMSEEYYFWASAEGRVEEPSHWMYQPVGFDRLLPRVQIDVAATPSELYLRSRIADLLHLLRGADIQCPTLGDSAQVEKVIDDLTQRLVSFNPEDNSGGEKDV